MHTKETMERALDFEDRPIQDWSRLDRLVIAALLVIAAAVVVFFGVSLLLRSREYLAGSVYESGIPLAVAGFTLASLPYVHQLLERRRRFSFTALPEKPVLFDNYLLPGHILVTYGIFILFAASGLAIFLIWLLGELSVFYLTRLIAPLNMIFMGLAFYLTGYWIGKRAARGPLWITFGVVFGYALLSMLIPVLLRAEFRWIASAASALLYLLLALFGLWRGRKFRLVRYFQYLLSYVPPENRPELADRLYQETQRFSNEI